MVSYSVWVGVVVGSIPSAPHYENLSFAFWTHMNDFFTCSIVLLDIYLISIFVVSLCHIMR